MINQKITTRTISSIDIGKFIACFFIVMLHCHVFDVNNGWTEFAITNLLLRISVPFFFVTSGYFLGKKIQSGADPKTTVFKYCKRLVFPLIVFSVINIAQHIYKFYCIDGDTLLVTLLKIGRSIIFYPLGALWFVQACIVGSLLLIPFFRRGNLKCAICIGLILFLIALPFNSYYFLVDGTVFQVFVDKTLKIISSIRNGVYVGFVYLAIGSYIGYNSISLSKLKCCFLMFLSIIALLGEILLVWNFWIPKDDTSLFLSHLILAPAILLLLLRSELHIPVSLSITLRNLSVGVYYLHKPILFFVTLFSFGNILSWGITFSLAVGICILFYSLNFETTNKLLK